jgi:hypothetical protein
LNLLHYDTLDGDIISLYLGLVFWLYENNYLLGVLKVDLVFSSINYLNYYDVEFLYYYANLFFKPLLSFTTFSIFITLFYHLSNSEPGE